MNQLVLSPAPAVLPAPLFAPTPKAAKRVLEFFATQINNDHTRKAYFNATRRFAGWCKARGIGELAGVEPVHVAPFIKELQNKPFPPRKKTVYASHGEAAPGRAAHAVGLAGYGPGHGREPRPLRSRAPNTSLKRSKTPVLTAEEARELLDSIPIVRNTGGGGHPEAIEPALVGLRDRALIGVMVYTFARVNAVLQMKVRDYFMQGRLG